MYVHYELRNQSPRQTNQPRDPRISWTQNINLADLPDLPDLSGHFCDTIFQDINHAKARPRPAG